MALCKVVLSTPISWLIAGTLRPWSSPACAWASRSGVSLEPPLRSAALKNVPAPFSRNRLTQRLTVTSGTPKASTI